ncbi:MAG: hypothetical protein ACFFCZ_27185 [Promethearchaeota archaeon]
MFTRLDDFQNNMNKYGLQIWLYQNLLMIFILLLFIPNIILFFFMFKIGAFIGGLMNALFYCAMLLDISAIILITFHEMQKIWLWRTRTSKELSRRLFITPLAGISWIGLTILWRLPWFLREPYELGVGLRYLTTSVYWNLWGYHEPGFALLFLAANFSFLIFVTRLGTFSSQRGHPTNFFQSYTSNRFFNYGFISLFSAILVVLDPLNFTIRFIGIISKFCIVPFVGLSAIKSLYGDLAQEETQEPGAFLSEGKNQRLIPINVSQRSIPIDVLKGSFRPSSKTILGVLLCAIVLVTIPVSPFFITKAWISVEANGPYVNRLTTDLEELHILQHVEGLNLRDLTGYPGDFIGGSYGSYGYVMNNETLTEFLDEIAGYDYSFSTPYSYYFNWTIAAYESAYPLLNASSFQASFPDWSIWDAISLTLPYTYLIWWSNNGTRNIIEGNFFKEGFDEWWWYPVLFYGNSSEGDPFISENLAIKWIVPGYFEYTYESIFSISKSTQQLLFLDENLDLVCFVISEAPRWTF